LLCCFCFAKICNTKASKIKQNIDSHFKACPDQTEYKLLAAVQTAAPVHHSPSEKNTQRPEANHLIVEYPKDKHRFTAYPNQTEYKLLAAVQTAAPVHHSPSEKIPRGQKQTT
jgi:hypothetical protein